MTTAGFYNCRRLPLPPTNNSKRLPLMDREQRCDCPAGTPPPRRTPGELHQDQSHRPAPLLPTSNDTAKTSMAYAQGQHANPCPAHATTPSVKDNTWTPLALYSTGSPADSETQSPATRSQKPATTSLAAVSQQLSASALTSTEQGEPFGSGRTAVDV